MRELILIKIGGGLITDKSKPLTIREDMMNASVYALALAIRKNPEASFIIGNGAGSFGHFVASQNRPDDAGRRNAEQVQAIHESVVRLNHIFVEKLLETGVPCVSVSPSSFITCRDGTLNEIRLGDVTELLSQRKIPLIFGDIVPDERLGGTILSTESLFETIVPHLIPQYENISVIYAGNTDGVLDAEGKIIPEISEKTWTATRSFLKQSTDFDVTGGMGHKIESALRMVHIATSVYILSGKEPEAIADGINGNQVGTRVVL